MLDMISLSPSWSEFNLLAQVDLPGAFSLQGGLGNTLLTVGKALLILIIGLIVVNILKGVLKSALHKTDIDNQIASWITGDSQESTLPVETWISEVFAWILTLFVVVAFLNALELEAVSQPLNALLQEVTRFLPRIGGAALLLALAWAIGTVVKLIVTNALDAFGLDEKINRQVREDVDGDGVDELIGEDGTPVEQEDRIALGATIGNALYWFIFLLFLPAILSVLQLEGTLRPLEELVNDILGVVPNVFAAIIIAAIGWVVAQVVKKVVTNLLKATPINQVGERFGLSGGVTSTGRRQSLAQIIGSVVYVLVLIPIAITALDALQIQAISEPAIDMLQQVLDLLPKLFAALVILGLAYVAGQYVSDLVTNLLTSVGFNNILDWLGIADIRRGNIDSTNPQELPENTTTMGTHKTPSEIVGAVVLVAIMLVAALTAVDILEIGALRQVVGVLLILAGQVLVGMLIFAVGLYFANLVFKLVANSGAVQAQFLAQTARIAIIVLVSAMALERIGIAPSIVNLAFGLITGGIAVAIALAFGLGGREAAGKALQEWLDSFKQK